MAIFIFFFSLFLFFRYPSIFSQFENKINDMMFLARGKRPADKNIIIIDIDEKSLKELGQWPWSRNIISKILKNLTNDGVGMIGLDVVFAEPDNSSPKKILLKLGLKSKRAEDYDKILAQTIKETPTIAGYVFNLKNDGIKPTRSPRTNAIIIEKNRPKVSPIIKAYRAILNIPIIQNSAYSSGYFNTIPDDDGVIRSIPMLISYDGNLYPSLSLEMIRNALHKKIIRVNYENGIVKTISIGKLKIPTDMYGRMIINYMGAKKSYRYISAIDIYNNSINKSLVQNKFALIGTSAAGLLDLRSTPFDAAYPGVEVHANAIDNIINQNFISTPQWTIGANILSLLLLSSIILILLFLPNIFMSLVLFILLDLAVLYLHYYYMFSKGIILNLLFPLICINILYFLGTMINFFYEKKQKNLIKDKFSKKVSADVVEELLKNSDKLLVQEKEITIFFSDIRGFTNISEQIGSAKKLITLLNDYMTPMVEIITNHKGTVDKFIGDSIMAYWNAPINIKLHADAALEASIEQIIKLEELNKTLAREKRPNIDIGIGLNSGKCIVGEMGSIGRSDYTCIGDAVNLASRIEGLCKIYGAKIIVSKFSKELLSKKHYLFRELDIVRVKGKEEPVAVFECYGTQKYAWVDFDNNSQVLYNDALNLYRNSNFKEALAKYELLRAVHSQLLYELYIDRCKYYIKYPPKDFDGIFNFKTK